MRIFKTREALPKQGARVLGIYRVKRSMFRRSREYNEAFFVTFSRRPDRHDRDGEWVDDTGEQRKAPVEWMLTEDCDQR